jgi:hypothetical protein
MGIVALCVDVVFQPRINSAYILTKNERLKTENSSLGITITGKNRGDRSQAVKLPLGRVACRQRIIILPIHERP